MKSINTTVCIIGGGPAGLMAGFECLRRDIDFILLEAQAMPREKACADIITSNAIREIERACPGIIQLWLDKGLSKPIWGTELKVDGQGLNIPFKGLNGSAEASCYSIPRKQLDMLLWDELNGRSNGRCFDQRRVIGHQLKKGSHIIRTGDGGEVVSDYCISASGGSKTEHRPRHTAIGVRAYFRGLKGLKGDNCYLQLDKAHMPGGFYIAPLADGIFNVNVVIRKDKVQKKNLNLRNEMLGLIEEEPSLKAIFKDAEMLGQIMGAPLPLATTSRRLSKNETLLAGDKAGLIDLISANGIPQAMISGRLSAEAISRQIAGSTKKESEEFYSKTLMQAISHDVELGRYLSLPLSSPWICSMLLNLIGQVGSRIDQNSNGLEELLYADRPIKEFLQLLNPLKRARTEKELTS